MCKRGTRAVDALRAKRDKRVRRRTGGGGPKGGRKWTEVRKSEWAEETRDCALTEKIGFDGHGASDMAMQRDATCMCDPDVAPCLSRRWPWSWS